MNYFFSQNRTKVHIAQIANETRNKKKQTYLFLGRLQENNSGAERRREFLHIWNDKKLHEKSGGGHFIGDYVI